MKKKLYSDFKIWISIYGAPVGLFILGTIFGQGALRTKLEVYSIAFLGALSLAIISRYSAYFLLDGKRALLSVLFIRREINVSDVSAAKSNLHTRIRCERAKYRPQNEEWAKGWYLQPSV